MKNPVSRLWGRLSLVQKSIIVGTFLLIVNTLVLSTAFNMIQEEYQIHALEEGGLAAARAMARVSEYGVITRNREMLNGQIQGMLSKNVSGIAVMDSDGNILAEAASGRPSSEDTAARQKLLNASGPSIEKVFDDESRLSKVMASYPIEFRRRLTREEIGLLVEVKGDKERIGMAVVSMDASQVYHDLAENRKAFAFLSFIVIAAGVAVIVVFVKVTARPLKKLVLATQRVAGGDLETKVETISADEIGNLARSFNKMVEKVKEAQERVVITERLAASGRLAADVAHEINNPLAIMKNYIYVISRKKMKEDDPNQQYLRIIDGEIDRIARIIRSFNDFYKGTQTVKLEEVDILVPLREVLDFCRVEMEGKGITIEERIAEGGRVMGNDDKLKQVFLNLFKNACEAMPDGGKLTVETRKSDGKIDISVTDTGMGIKKEDMNRIFDPFFSTKGVKGTGLGLSVSYGIVRSLNGSVEVESEVGKGTTFRVTLPTVS
jgi:signal transduction histidine kinase